MSLVLGRKEGALPSHGVAVLGRPSWHVAAKRQCPQTPAAIAC